VLRITRVGFLYLARHGETDWNRAGRWQGQTDTFLNDAGRAQATDLARLLENRGVTRVIASNLARAGETARIVSHALGAGPVALDGDLRERSFGCFEGLTREECAERFPEDWTRYSLDRRVTPEGAESHEDVLRRMQAAVLRVVSAMSNGESILLVSHGGSIRIWFTGLTGQPLRPIANGEVLRFAVTAGAIDYQGMLEASTV